MKVIFYVNLWTAVCWVCCDQRFCISVEWYNRTLIALCVYLTSGHVSVFNLNDSDSYWNREKYIFHYEETRFLFPFQVCHNPWSNIWNGDKLEWSPATLIDFVIITTECVFHRGSWTKRFYIYDHRYITVIGIYRYIVVFFLTQWISSCYQSVSITNFLLKW